MNALSNVLPTAVVLPEGSYSFVWMGRTYGCDSGGNYYRKLREDTTARETLSQEWVEAAWIIHTTGVPAYDAGENQSILFEWDGLHYSWVRGEGYSRVMRAGLTNVPMGTVSKDEFDMLYEKVYHMNLMDMLCPSSKGMH